MPRTTRQATLATPSILQQAVILILRQGAPGNLRKVRGAEVVETGEALSAPVTVDADKTLVHVSKYLFESGAYRAVLRYDGQTRDWLVRRALPSYFREGFYLLPLALLEEVDADLAARQRQRQTLIEAFLSDYETTVEDAKARLRGLFNPADYLTRDALAAAFRFEVSYLTLEVPQTLEGVSPALFQRERDKAEALWTEAAEAIQQALRTSMAELVAHMVDRLSAGADGKPKQFRPSLVTNMEEFLRYFQARNLTNDEDLAALVDKAQLVMKGVDIKALRQNADVRDRVREGFARLQSVMDRMTMVRPSRGITFEDA